MKHSLNRQFYVIAICGLLFLLHLGIAWATGECSWLTRSGTSIVVAGLVFEAWKVLTVSGPDKLPFYTTPEAFSAIRASIWIVCAGTLMQGYADLPFRGVICI